MKRDLKNFKKDTQQPNTAQSGNDIDNAKAMMEHYSNYNEAQLTSELMDIVGKQKADGTFNAAKLDELSGMLGPMLDSDQKQKLANIIAQLRR
jgi:hypothetical protein